MKPPSLPDNDELARLPVVQGMQQQAFPYWCDSVRMQITLAWRTSDLWALLGPRVPHAARKLEVAAHEFAAAWAALPERQRRTVSQAVTPERDLGEMVWAVGNLFAQRINPADMRRVRGHFLLQGFRESLVDAGIDVKVTNWLPSFARIAHYFPEMPSDTRTLRKLAAGLDA